MSIALLELAADALGPLLDEVMFLGGASVELWITDPAAPAPRPTKDVDVVVEVTSLLGYEKFSERMRARGFVEDIESGVICRWRHAGNALILDAMPASATILGFSNRWQVAALAHGVKRRLPSGIEIRAITPPYLLATKLEAFASRGRSDLLASHDFEDAIALIDGREEIVEETRRAPRDVRAFLASELATLRAHRRFRDGVAGALPPDAASQARAEAIVLPRLLQIEANASGPPSVDPARLRADIDELLDSSL